MRERMEAGRDGGNDSAARAGHSFWRSAVRARAQPRAVFVGSRVPRPLLSRAPFSHGRSRRRQTSAAASNAGASSTGQSVMKLCASQWKEAKAAGTTAGQTLAAVSVAMPHAPKLGRRALGRFRSRAGPSPSARSCRPVRLPVPMVATVGARFRNRIECRRALNPAGRRIHNRTRGARPVPVGHRRVGQHADAHLSLFGNPLLSGIPSRAPICAKLTRAGPDIARRGTANGRPETHSG